MSGKTRKTVDTVWEVVYHYDVINDDGIYQVNDSSNQGETTLRLKIVTNNKGTSGQHQSAYPSDYQIKKVFGINCRIDKEGDDMVIYINRSRDLYPIGELRCISHSSLSPIKPL